MKKAKNLLPFSREDMMVYFLLLLVIGLGGYLQLHQIGKFSFWLDEAFTFAHVKISIPYAIAGDPNMSLYDALAFVWMRVLPKLSDGRLRALSAIFSIMTIPVVFLIGKTLSQEKRKANAIGLVAALLIALNVFVIQYAQEFRSYSLDLFLTTLSTFFLIKAIEELNINYGWLIAFVIASAASFYSHFFMLLLFASQIICLLSLYFMKGKNYLKDRRLIFCGIAWFFLILPIGIVAAVKGSGQIGWISPLNLKTFENFLFKISGNPSGSTLFILAMVASCIGLFLVGKDVLKTEPLKAWRLTLIIACLVLPVLFAVIFSLLVMPVFNDKYLIYVIPYLALLTANGIVAIASYGWKIKKFIPLFLIVGTCFFGLFIPNLKNGIQSYYDYYQKEDWRDAVQFVSKDCSGSLILYYSTYIEYPVFYYDPQLDNSQVDWWNKLSLQNLDSTQLAALLPQNDKQVCLVLSHAKSSVDVIRAALSSIYPHESTQSFIGVEVDVYKR